MQAVTDERIGEAVELLHKAPPEAAIILFGSWARGEANEESDADFLFELNPFTPEFRNDETPERPEEPFDRAAVRERVADVRGWAEEAVRAGGQG